MTVNNKEYKARLMDDKIDKYLNIFGAISIVGPKWCGKTWTSIRHSKTLTFMDDDNNKELALLDPKSIIHNNLEERPQLIDEWHLVPSIWDVVRRECDKSSIKGNFILTGSTTLAEDEQKEKIKHSGIGRIAKVKMYTMSLFESGDSTGKASIIKMYNGIQETLAQKDVTLDDLAYLIIRGGWPANMNIDKEDAGIIPKAYIESILDSDMNEGENKRRDKDKMKMLLRSLARNESSIANNKTILNDISLNETDDILSNRRTVTEYLDILNRLYLIENQEPYVENYRSSERIGKSVKRHLTDPSLSCAILGLTKDSLIKDIKTFGFMFEALVERDLRIYMSSLNGSLYHFRDNVSRLEVDSILEFENGDYAAIEIKLGLAQIEDAKKNLLNFYSNMEEKPKFMCIIVGLCKSIVKDKETGIYIVPITSLKP